MAVHAFSVLGRGVFSLREASRLTGLPQRRVRRWVAGYEYRPSGGHGARYSPPPIHADYAVADGRVSLSFADLVEVRFLEHFVEAGVSWPTIRAAYQKASELLDKRHPFSSLKFKTDGKTILAEISTSAETHELLDLLRDQMAMRKVLDRFLYAELDFGPDGSVARWWHRAGSRKVVIDPKRSFGEPIISKWGIPTRTLAKAVLKEQSVELVAAQFEIPKSSVAAAVDFERRLDS